VPDPQDIIEIRGEKVRSNPAPAAKADSAVSPRAKFLSVWFRCCHTYGRMNQNAQGTAYEGRCPKCGSKVQAAIGPGGTTRRAFEAT